MDFWTIIDKARTDSEGDQEVHCEIIFGELEKCTPEEILSFQTQLDELMAKAYRWDLWGAAFLVNGGCSDDGFYYFCLWLISCGKKVYDAAIDNPESLCDLDLSDEYLEFEDLDYIAGEVYQKKTGKEIPDTDVNLPKDPVGKEWREEELFLLYPKLLAKVLPDEFPDLTHMIDDITAGAGQVEDLYPHFKNKTDALEYYASIMTLRYSEETPIEKCQLCENVPVVEKYPFIWHATISNRVVWNVLKSIFLLPLALLIVFIPIMKVPNIYADTVGVALSTTFHVCKECNAMIKKRRLLASFIAFWFVLATFIGFCGTLFMGIMQLSFLCGWLEPFPKDEMPGFHTAFFSCVAALIISRIFMHPVQNYILLPEKIHRLIKKPFKFVSNIAT